MTSFYAVKRRGAGRKLPYEGGEIASLPAAGSLNFKDIVVVALFLKLGITLYRDFTKPKVPASEHRPFTKDQPLGTLTGRPYFADEFNALF